ncbi:cupin domain-containing protein [Pontibacter oryzae]|uniref:Cupin domain-containing protein n=1 Tax=Pontibacter oryzae TaxID=2304593 RepID=A0A399SL59_9BACT|nr:cupin domain-containing protein [Pontibacter oryzae]RIJ42515.1 cupin domain-containing protein [Pontibacter oryzae]
MQKQSEEYLFGETLAWEEVAPGVKRQLMGYDGTILMAKVQFEVGSVGAVHEHFHAQATYVVSGAFEVEIDGQKKVLRAGDGFYIPPHVWHGAVCQEAGVLIDVFSPIREDFFKPETLTT